MPTFHRCHQIRCARGSSRRHLIRWLLASYIHKLRSSLSLPKTVGTGTCSILPDYCTLRAASIHFGTPPSNLPAESVELQIVTKRDDRPIEATDYTYSNIPQHLTSARSLQPRVPWRANKQACADYSHKTLRCRASPSFQTILEIVSRRKVRRNAPVTSLLPNADSSAQIMSSSMNTTVTRD